jgi:hypothetical protein
MQWLTHNAVWLGSAAALAFLLTELVWKPLRSIASFCWSRFIPAHKPGPRLPVTDLRFIAIPGECRCSVGKVVQKVGHDEFTEIHGCWYVTNASEPKIPLLLLKARMEPPIGGPCLCEISFETGTDRPRGHGDRPERHPIQPGETRKMSIHFFQSFEIVDIHPTKAHQLLRVVFVITDQFGREHRIPPLLFRLWRYIKDKNVASAHTAE